jgi:hypothetical protein
MVEIGVPLDEGNPGGSASGNQVALNDGNSASVQLRMLGSNL